MDFFMLSNRPIQKIAVLGAGVMGAQIAAHCANAGFPTLLFDLAASGNQPYQIVEKALANLKALKPAPLALPSFTSLIQACQYDDDLAQLKQCDLIIEAIAERMDLKCTLYQRIAPYISSHAILASNTSGLSINAIADVLPSALRTQFCGVHFFNPPRYMHLVELISNQYTPPALLDNLETWLTRYLGKGVVRAKDTPNFIANRIGVFSLLITLHHAQHFHLSLDVVDALTGALIGRPKSATCRTMDVVGLDTLQHVVQTMAEQLKDDPWHRYFTLPEWLLQLIQQGHLGQKTGQGLYRKQGKIIEVYDPSQATYRVANGVCSLTLLKLMQQQDASIRMQALFESDDPQAQFLACCFRDLFQYCAYHLSNIAESVRDVDQAMCWGFGWQQGPFATWQAAGIERCVHAIKSMPTIERGDTASIRLDTSNLLPVWLEGLQAFYDKDGQAYNVTLNAYQANQGLPVYQRQAKTILKSSSSILKHEGVSLSVVDDVAVVSFGSKANAINQAVIDGLFESIDYAEQRDLPLVIYQHNPQQFSAGADLRQVSQLMQKQQFQALENMLAQFQQVVLRLQYSRIPTVAALQGRALGGGCELLLHCDRVVAAFESYPGLVEVGVGLIPGGGGCKEMAKRAALQAEKADLMSFLQPYFERIAMAKVASNAIEAKQWHYLRAQDHYLMASDEVLLGAMTTAKAIQTLNYLPPRADLIAVAGRQGHARLQVMIENQRVGSFISDYDALIVSQLGYALCGGDVDAGALVSEAWMLKLERDVFIHLAQMPATQARVQYLLETGQPLRN